MNLGELAAVVCSKIGKTDSESIEACKTYLRQRHEVIYDSSLWKDSIGVWEVTTVAGSQFAVMPFECARPLALWNKEQGLQVPITSISAILMTRPAAIEEVGGLLGFSEAEAVGWPYDLGTGDRLSFINAGNPEIQINISGWGQTAVLPLLDLAGSETLTAGEQGGLVLSSYWGRIDRMTKPQTPSAVVVGQTGTSQAWLWPASETEASFARVRLYSPTETPVTLGVIGKRKLRQMNLDTDGPMIRGIDNVLLAFAQADMLERSRQYSKAQAKAGEAAGLLKVSKDQEINQSAYEARIVPFVVDEPGSAADMGW